METPLCSCFAKQIWYFSHLDASIGQPPLLKRSLERSLTRECQDLLHLRNGSDW